MGERRGADDRPFRPASHSEDAGFWRALFWVLVAAVLLYAYWSQRNVRPATQSAATTHRPVPAPPVEVKPPQGRTQPPSAPAVAKQPAAPRVQRCDGNGAVSFTDAACANGMRATETNVQAGAALPATRNRQDDGTTPGTIYHCRAYDGRTFWAQAHCNRHQAHIIEMARVPPNIGFQQQVEIASQRNPNSIRHGAPEMPGAAHVETRRAASGVCQQLEAEIRDIDVRTRQPLSAQEQDYWKGRRKDVRDAQFRIPCS